MKIRLLLFTLLSLFMLSCTKSHSNTEKSIITDIIQQIQISFNQRDLESLFKLYSRDFRHNGTSLDGILVTWQDRYNRYTNLQIDIIDIDIINDSAIVKLKVTFDREPTYIDPEMHGDMSYFYKLYGDWKIVGNEFIE